MNCSDKIPKLSVIMGVYNIASLPMFRDSVESILSQTFRDFEFIICDDGSTDETWSILQHIGKSDTRIHLLKNTINYGLAFTLNKCIEKSRGEYIARQDADDISISTRFSKQIQFLEKHPQISFVGSSVSLWNRKGKWGERYLPAYPCKKDFLMTSPFVHGALLFRRTALFMVDEYRVATETRRAEDYDMLMRMYNHGLYGANLNEILYEYWEDIESLKYRRFHFRLDEMKIRYRGFQSLELMPLALIFVIKPLFVGILPKRLLHMIRLKRFNVIE